jgi:predicted RND superfamily exporter protein
LGIGVDDAFLLLHAWIGTAQKGLTPKARIVHIVSEMGPAMSITTVTNVLTFAVGIFTPTIGIFVSLTYFLLCFTKENKFMIVYNFEYFYFLLCL